MAEAFFNYLAGGRALASPAGTNPSADINPVAEVMGEAGTDIHKASSI